MKTDKRKNVTQDMFDSLSCFIFTPTVAHLERFILTIAIIIITFVFSRIVSFFLSFFLSLNIDLFYSLKGGRHPTIRRKTKPTSPNAIVKRSHAVDGPQLGFIPCQLTLETAS